jgi:hypothetical protein
MFGCDLEQGAGGTTGLILQRKMTLVVAAILTTDYPDFN